MSSTLKKITVGVLRGGPSGEYEVSLKTGANILKHLGSLDHYAAKDIFIDKSGIWHIDGLARSPDRALRGIDIAFNALHGTYGEDGRVQQILESHGVPYTGSNPLGSAIAMNKILSKKYFKENGIPIGDHIAFRKGDNIANSHEKLSNKPHLKVVKPVSSGSSLGMTVIRDMHELPTALEKAFQYSDTVMVEEFFQGREATCGVLESSDGKHIYPLPPVEIKDLSKNGEGFWGYESKYSNDLHELICPGNFTKEETYQIQQLAVAAHKALGLRHYSRTDIMITPKGMFVLEVNTLPGLTDASLLPKSLAAAGCTFPEFLDHLIILGLRG